MFLHRAAARANGIPAFGLARDFHDNRASAGRIRAMPALAGFHRHGIGTSLRLVNKIICEAWAKNATIRVVYGT